MTESPWSRPVRWSDLGRGPSSVGLEADAPTRTRIARALGLPAIARLKADITVTPWLDGARIDGHIDAQVTQICGVSLDPFEAPVTDDFMVRVVPAGSPNAAQEDAEDALLDPEREDPPDVVDGDTFDIAAYVVEDLALALDPFPRKPGVTFEPPADATPESPFAVLKALKKSPPE